MSWGSICFKIWGLVLDTSVRNKKALVSSETTALRVKYTKTRMDINAGKEGRWEPITVAETEIRKGTHTVRCSFLGKDVPNLSQYNTVNIYYCK